MQTILLSTQDKADLEYFPVSTVVFQFGKAYKWSNLYHLHQRKASNASLLMRAILALSASERHRMNASKDLTTLTQAEDPGLYHYSLALQELSVALGDAADSK